MTSHDVARLAGVSQPTVSRAMRNSPSISSETKNKVLMAAKTLGYVPSATGRALSRGRSDRVGLLVTDLTNRFYPHIIAPIHRELREQNLELVLLTDGEPHSGVADHVRANDLDGVILATMTLTSIVPVRLRDRGIPFVYFNRFATTMDADTVSADPTAGVDQLADRLLDLGHHRIAAIYGPPEASTGHFRAEALRRALESRGLTPDPADERVGDFVYATGYNAARELMAQTPRPTAIVCANDVIAEGALNALTEMGVSIPGEVSVIGFDDLPESSWPILSLSSVRFDLNAMASRAAALLAERITHPQGPFVHERFPTTFIERGSIGPARG